jgi:hypothetical protein
MPSAIDLTTVARVKAWIGSAASPGWQANHAYALGAVIVDAANHVQKCTTPGTSGSTIPTFNDAGGTTSDGPTLVWADTGLSEDQLIQDAITAASDYWLWRTGRGPSDGSTPATSPFVTPIAYNEWYDGNGSQRLFLRNSPIVSVQALAVSGSPMQAANGFGSSGYRIHQDGRSLILQDGGGSGSTITNVYPGGWWLGGTYFRKGVQNVNVQYTAGFATTPPDVEMACRKMVALAYKERQAIGQKSQAMAQGAGTVTWDFNLTPEINAVMMAYTRTAMP